MVAQGVAVSPSLIYISESGSAGIAIGANIVGLTPSLRKQPLPSPDQCAGYRPQRGRSLASGQAAPAVFMLFPN